MGQNDNNKHKNVRGKDHAPSKRRIEDVTVEADIQAHLGKWIREIYQTLVDEPVPDKFIRLLSELENKEKLG